MKRTVDTSKQVDQKKAKLGDSEAIKKLTTRNSNLIREIAKTNEFSIHDVIEHNLVERDENNLIVKQGGETWSDEYINVASGGPLACDMKFRNLIARKMGEYTENVLRGIPSTPELNTKMRDLGERIEALNEERDDIVTSFNEEIADLIWDEANKFVRLRSQRRRAAAKLEVREIPVDEEVKVNPLVDGPL